MTRRRWIHTAAWTVVALLGAAFAAMLRRQVSVARRPRRVVVPRDLADRVAFVDEVIVCRTATQVHVWSARCTHLGCLITRAVDGVLTCPCHGSGFHLDGRVAVGPAPRPLDPLPYELDPRTGDLVVHVP